MENNTQSDDGQASGSAVGQKRLVLCEYRTHKGRTINRWLKPETVVEAKHSCGCEEYMYARDIGKRPCMLCMEETENV